jgi:hypothetical protein
MFARRRADVMGARVRARPSMMIEAAIIMKNL